MDIFTSPSYYFLEDQMIFEAKLEKCKTQEEKDKLVEEYSQSGALILLLNMGTLILACIICLLIEIL